MRIRYCFTGEMLEQVWDHDGYVDSGAGGEKEASRGKQTGLGESRKEGEEADGKENESEINLKRNKEE
jgi:hypothetical protein